jgi:ABC-type multidrug transport system fused ATPase/permease subunit
VVRITGITVYMLIRCPQLGACALGIVPLVAVVNKYYGNWQNKNARKVQDATAAANSVAQETLSCMRTVVAFASEDLEHNKYTEKVDVQYQLNVKQVGSNKHWWLLILLSFSILIRGLPCFQRRSSPGFTLCLCRPSSSTRWYRDLYC